MTLPPCWSAVGPGAGTAEKQHGGIGCDQLAAGRWLETLRLPRPAQQVTLEEHIQAVDEATARVQHPTQQLAAAVETWPALLRAGAAVADVPGLGDVAPVRCG